MNSVPVLEVGPLQRQNLLKSIPKLSGRRIMIVGDVGIDEYIMGQVRRISPEAPVPVLEVEKEDLRLGLSANVAQNIVSLGGDAVMISVVGQDQGAQSLKELLGKQKISADFLVFDVSRPTTRKSRVMAKHHHLVRVDYETRKFLSPEIETAVMKQIETQMAKVDAVILQDYAKGVISENIVQHLVKTAHHHGKKVFVDPTRENKGSFYKGIDLFKPNFDEAVALSGISFDEVRHQPHRVLEIGRNLQKLTSAEQVVLTRGKDGMLIFSGSEVFQVPTFAKQVFDVTGAGDTVIATLTMALASGVSLPESAMLANFAAGVVVAQVGCVPCTTNELIEAVQASVDS